MTTVKESAKQLQVMAETDVLVCGGGPAGFMAAIAAARSGARTMLVERYGFLGGMATVGLVGPISKFRCKGELIVGGIPWEFIQRMERNNGAISDLPSGNIPFDPEVYKLIAMQMVRESGVDLLLHAYAVGCIQDPKQDGKLSHVIIESKSGRQAIRAKIVIDCTGDADVAAKAGFDFERSSSEDGETQPMTLYFRMGGVDTDRVEKLLMSHDNTKYAHQRMKDALAKAREDGLLPNFGGPWLVHGSTIQKGEVSANVTRFPGNAINVRSLTEAECMTRENMFQLIPFMKEVLPEWKDAYLISSSTQVGIRESRRIKGLYQMTGDDILTPQPFPDTVGKGAHPIDIHSSKDNTQHVVFVEEPYNITYRSLVPVGSVNVLVAGRCVSATKEAFGSIRVQAQCMALGQGAGTAAALCVRNDCAVYELDGAELREALAIQGAIV
jgi:hypothetical protein